MIEKLAYRNRCLRTKTGKLLFGPTGRRLFADYLDKKPGFSGRIDFIHKINLTSLFTVDCSADCDFETAEAVWYADRLTLCLVSGGIAFSETKFITENDCAVSCQYWENNTSQPVSLSLEVGADLCTKEKDVKTGARMLITPSSRHGYRTGAAVKSDIQLEQNPLIVKPGQSVTFTVVAAVGNLEQEPLSRIAEKAEQFFKNGVDYTERQRAEYEAFFDHAPRFSSSSEILNTTWAYRWFLLRHNLAFPDMGNLQGAVMYEGRSHKMKKDPLNPSGWEFSKLINLSTPLHLTDFRWYGKKEYLYDMVRNMIRNLDENGIFCSATVGEKLHSYANYGVYGIYKLWQTDGNTEFIKEIMPDIKKYVHRETKVYSRGDNLQIEIKHNRTGKEYQPSYWYFHNFPHNPKDPQTYTPLKRVDRSVYHYLNVMGAAYLCEAVGDDDGRMFLDIGEEIKRDILKKMWDKDTEFFYDLHHETDEKAYVKNIVGVYPYWADITGREHLPGLELLFDNRYFNTGCPFPSVARDCQVYSPMGSWNGNYIKGRDGCVWCGPSWPYTTCIALDAIGKQSRKNNHVYDSEFIHYLKEYSLQHYRDRDLKRPYMVEHYNAETGEPLSDDVDYNHSYYIDLIITYVAGVEITEKGLAFNPLDCGLNYFELDRLSVRGDTYAVTYRRPGCEDVSCSHILEGYTVYKNGEILLSRKQGTET